MGSCPDTDIDPKSTYPFFNEGSLLELKKSCSIEKGPAKYDCAKRDSDVAILKRLQDGIFCQTGVRG